MARNAAEAIVVWSLSAVLAAIFLITGGSKLLGFEPLGLAAASMATFPLWIRMVVGVVEIAGAIALLIPGIAHVAALILAGLMVPATITQLASGEPGAWIPIVLLVALLFVAWRRDPEDVRDAWRSLRETPHPVLREGVIAGIIGATVVAIWFLIIDTVAGRPLFTPAVLGSAMFSVLGEAPAGESEFVYIAAYTVVHYVAFIGVGILASFIIDLAHSEPSVLLGFVILFVAFEVGFHAGVALLEQVTRLEMFAWYQVAIGNLLAAASMGVYLWRAHAELKDEFAHALDPEPPPYTPPVNARAAGTYSAPSDTRR